MNIFCSNLTRELRRWGLSASAVVPQLIVLPHQNRIAPSSQQTAAVR